MSRFVPDAAATDRLKAVAQILATGLVRFQRRLRQTAGNQSSEQPQNSLDVVAEIRLHVPTGSAGERPERTGERQEP